MQASSGVEPSLAELQERLDEAVAPENYQAAAELRDNIMCGLLWLQFLLNSAVHRGCKAGLSLRRMAQSQHCCCKGGGEVTADWLWRRPTGASMMPSSAAASRHALHSLVQGGNASSNTFTSLWRPVAYSTIINATSALATMWLSRDLAALAACTVTQHMGHPQPAF